MDRYRALLFVALSACTMPLGGSGHSTGGSASNGTPPSNHVPPTIDDLAMPASASPDPDGYYTLQGSITFHSDDLPVHEVHVKVPVIGKTFSFSAGDQLRVYGEPLVVRMSADLPLGGAGATEYDVILVDTAGTESTVAREQVVLQ